MNENENTSFWYSWPVIIIAMFVFWPLSIYLIIKRVSVDKKAAMKSGKLVGFLGGFCYFIAIAGLISSLTDGNLADNLVIIIFFWIAGVFLKKTSKKIKKEAESIKKYLAIIVNGNQREISNIAVSVGKSYENTKNDIQNMINKGYLKNAYINEGTNEIVFTNNKVQTQTTVMVNAEPKANTVTSKIVACPCCGANNTIKGEMGECEYCGSPLK